MRFMHPERDSLLELSLDDVFIVPGRFEGASRMEVSLTPDDGAAGSASVRSHGASGCSRVASGCRCCVLPPPLRWRGGAEHTGEACCTKAGE